MSKTIHILIIFGFTISILFQSCAKDSNGNGTPVNPGTVTDVSGNHPNEKSRTSEKTTTHAAW